MWCVIYISFRLWFNPVIGYQTCLLFWANFRTFVLYLHTFHVSVSLLCSERLENCVVFSSLKFLWIKVSAKWINVNVDIKNVKVCIWALKICLISGRFSIRLLRIGSQPLLVDLVTTPFAFSFEGNSELAGDVFSFFFKVIFWKTHIHCNNFPVL